MRLRDIDGLPVMHAKKPITLTINDNDIAKAARKKPADCAVARACRREFHAKEVRVHLGRVYLKTNNGNWTRYLTPKSMRDEIIAFDRGGSFEAGEFILAPPYATAKAVNGRRQGGKSRNARPRPAPKHRRSKPHIVTNVRSGPAA
jgi:hypothetical protein